VSPKKEGMSLISADLENWLPWQHPLSDTETNTRSNINSHMSTKPENLVRIGLVGSEISLLQMIMKKDER